MRCLKVLCKNGESSGKSVKIKRKIEDSEEEVFWILSVSSHPRLIQLLKIHLSFVWKHRSPCLFSLRFGSHNEYFGGRQFFENYDLKELLPPGVCTAHQHRADYYGISENNLGFSNFWKFFWDVILIFSFSIFNSSNSQINSILHKMNEQHFPGRNQSNHQGDKQSAWNRHCAQDDDE